MSKAGDLLVRITSSIFGDRFMSEADKKSVKNDVTNQKRGGTYVDQHHIDHAMSNLDRTRALYKAASNEPDVQKQEILLARVFNDKEVAKNIGQAFYSKEARAGVSAVDDFDALSRSLVTGRPSKPGQSAQISADSVKADIAAKQKPDKEVEKDWSNAKFITSSIRHDTRDPEEIYSSNEVIDLLYRKLEKDFKGDIKPQLILTYILLRSNNAHLVYKGLPHYNALMGYIKEIEKRDDAWTSVGQFLRQAGISKQMYAGVMKSLADSAMKLTGDETAANSFYLTGAKSDKDKEYDQ